MSTESVLITGCSDHGLGSAIALAFHKQGLHVFATARNPSKLSQLSNLENITLLTLDITSPTSIAAAVKSVKEKGAKLKYLVNNSGVGMVMPLLDSDMEASKKLFDVNVWAMLEVTKAFVPSLVESKGAIVNVGSSAGLLPLPWTGVYASSKAAENIMSETLRHELQPLGVNVITVVAGIIRSNFHANIPEFELPSTSLYRSLEKEIRAVAGGGDLPANSMSAEQFGREVVSDVMAEKRGNVYRGTLAWGAKWIPLFPTAFLDWYCRDRGQTKNFLKG